MLLNRVGHVRVSSPGAASLLVMILALDLRGLVVNSWRRVNLLSVLLLPLSAIYWCLLNAHRALYVLGFKSSRKASLPVVVVGNLSVGGTGKTPLVIYLVDLLKREGFRPGVVSRGYKSTSQQDSFMLDSSMSASLVGDEPSLIAGRTNVPVAVGANRHQSIDLLRDLCDVIVCDDGLQHWPLVADLRLCINDGSASSNPFLLPAGPWREMPGRLASMDIIVERDTVERDYEANTQSQFLMQLEPSQARNLVTDKEGLDADQVINAVAGIAQPSRFFDTCKTLGFSIIEHEFADHHQFVESDLDFNQTAVLMTEKDAVKCRQFAKPYFWYLPVTASLSPAFDTSLLKQLDKAIKQRS